MKNTVFEVYFSLKWSYLGYFWVDSGAIKKPNGPFFELFPMGAKLGWSDPEKMVKKSIFWPKIFFQIFFFEIDFLAIFLGQKGSNISENRAFFFALSSGFTRFSQKSRFLAKKSIFCNFWPKN